MLELNKIQNWQFITAIFFVLSINLNAEDDKKDFEYFFKKLYQNKLEEINHPILSLKLSKNDIFLNTGNDNYFPETYSYEFYYGFFRKQEEYYYDDYIYHSSEYAFGGNTTSKLDPNVNLGKIFDSWRFGFGWQDGYGYKVNNLEIFLIHKGSFNWTNISLNYDPNLPNMNKFTDGLSFGTNFGSGVMVKLLGPFHLEILYEKSHIHPRYVFGEQVSSWMLENILQRWLDFFEYELAYKFGNKYPVYYFLYKTAVSATIYKFREDNMNFPFKSSTPIISNGININFKFVF